MAKNLGVIAVPYDVIVSTPEDIKHMLNLPEGVKVYRTYEDWYRQTLNFMVISDTPVEGVTFPTEPGSEVPYAEYKLDNGFIKVGRS